MTQRPLAAAVPGPKRHSETSSVEMIVLQCVVLRCVAMCCTCVARDSRPFTARSQQCWRGLTLLWGKGRREANPDCPLSIAVLAWGPQGNIRC